MGRPIQKKYFGNKNLPDYANVSNLSGVGGEGVNTFTVSNSGTNYSQGTTVAVTGGTLITGGSASTISYAINSAGNIAVTKVTPGVGYTSAPSVAVTTATAVVSVTTGSSATTVIYPAITTGIYVGMKVIGTGISASATYVTSVVGGAVNLTWPNASNVSGPVITMDVGASFASSVALFASATTQNAIAFTSFLLAKDGGASAVANGDIIKQEASRRYLVTNSQGTGQVKLVADVPTAGQMSLIATDVGGATYYVIKLTAHKATLVNIDGTPLFADNAATGWTLGSATGTVVTIASN